MVYTFFFRLSQLFALLAIIVAPIAKKMGFLLADQLETALWHMLGLVVCGAVATAGMSLFKKSLRKLQYVSDTPTSKIRSAAQGYVELKGSLQPIQQQALLISPLSHTPCLWFEYEIERHSSDKNGRSTWTSIDAAHSNEGFCLIDDSGQCRINPEGADITKTHQTKIWQGDQLHPQRSDQRPRWQKIFSSKRYRYTEHFLLPNRTLYALGYFHSKNGQHILEKPLDGQPFILSGQEETEVISSSRSDARVGVVIFFIAVMVAAVIIWHWQR